MTATKVRIRAKTEKELREEALLKIWRCRFCIEGHHKSCPRAVWHGDILWKCRCTEGLSGHAGLHCTVCKHEGVGELDEESWRCLDLHGCSARQLVRQQHNPLFAQLQACKSRSAIKRRAERLGLENVLSGIDPTEDARIEYLHNYLDQLEAVRKKTRAPRVSRPPKATTGSCECCGEATRGGRFVPGHDAKLASALRKRVESGDAGAYEEIKRRNWLNKLPVAFRDGVK